MSRYSELVDDPVVTGHVCSFGDKLTELMEEIKTNSNEMLPTPNQDD